jgi:uncharacterized membrane protein
MSKFRRIVLAGFFVTVPLVVSIAALLWLFGIVDGLTEAFTTPLARRMVGPVVPATMVGLLAAAMGVVITFLVLLAVGAVATNVIGRRIVAWAERWLLRVPVFRTIYAPVKQLVAAFSPDARSGFKRVVMVEDARRGWVIGFLTKEFTVNRGRGPELLMAVYVPTNHLYLGDVTICSPEGAYFPDLSVKEGVQMFLTGGMSLPQELRSRAGLPQPGSPPAAAGAPARARGSLS